MKLYFGSFYKLEFKYLAHPSGYEHAHSYSEIVLKIHVRKLYHFWIPATF